ncbi:MAG: hypothetical protein NT067_00430 [Candidatus Diapherotrites archaeon]|nr:hypothetical protein [Candidatus Diapherotrites archaeon]
MDEMMLEMAKEYFSGMESEEKKEFLREFIGLLLPEEKEEILGMLLEEFCNDKKMLEKIKAFAKKSENK